MNKIYDVIIIGSGPAGLSAALYAGRAKLSTLVIEQAVSGGQIIFTGEIDNYPGAFENESGASLISRMEAQARRFGAEFVTDQVIGVDLKSDVKGVFTFAEDYFSKTVILASGATQMKLGVPGEEQFIGKGISFCATCDAAFFEGLPVYVVGGGDAAVEEGLYLTKFASSVTIIHRRDTLKAAKSIQEKAFVNPKINFIWNSSIVEFKGDQQLEGIVIKNNQTGKLTEINGMFGVFIFVGFTPATAVFSDDLALEKGYIRTDEEMRTALPGVFAAGDCRVKSLRQVVTAVSDGAIAAVSAGKFIEEHR